jgi:hypothetical protein
MNSTVKKILGITIIMGSGLIVLYLYFSHTPSRKSLTESITFELDESI